VTGLISERAERLSRALCRLAHLSLMTAMEEGGFVPGAHIRERLLPNSPEPPH